jgi:MoxR-like ATPase
MAISDHLRTILDGYVQSRQQQPFPGEFRPIFDRLAEALADLPSVRAHQGLKVRAGFGMGGWSRAPWVCLMDPRGSTSPQAGVFVNLKFRQDMAGIYLSLNQGHSRDAAVQGRRQAHALWRRRAEELRALAGDLPKHGFRLDGEADLGLDDARAAEDFRVSTAAWIYHSAEAVPEDTVLDSEIGALLRVYQAWLEERREDVEPLDASALEAMRQSFLRRMGDFRSFADPGQGYPREERIYKDHLAAVFRGEVRPLLAAPPETAEAAEAAIAALNELLTRRKLDPGQKVQNLVNWRTTEHLRLLRGEEALRAARLYADLLNGDGETPDRVESFSSGYIPILARHMKSGLQGVTRSLPTLLLMLADPKREIFVRTTLLDATAQRLLGHRLLSPDPLTAGDYAACRDFARRIRSTLQDWGWQPKDMIDVQGFLWVAQPEAPAEDLAFREALDPSSERRIYKIAPGRQAKYWEDCRQGGFICVGWDDVGDLREFTAEDEQSFVEVFRETFEESYTGSPQKLATGTRKARELWLLRDIQPGDIVVANRGIGEILAMGEVLEPGYEFDPSRETFRHLVRVRWNEALKRDVSTLLPANVRVVWSNTTIVPVERELYAAIFEGRPVKVVPDAYNPPSFRDIVTSISKSGLRLSERTIRRYHAAVQARGFVILAGVSGTGKTWLAEAYADAIGARFLSVRVAPNWHSNEDLLGYMSPLTGEYQHTGFSRFLIEADSSFRQAASAEAARPFHVLLDEMNLARVEHYFADFLSALEQRQRRGEVTLTLGSQEVTVHRNLVFVGTVNMDETTHGFAPKVFDRAQLIEVELDPALFTSHVATREYARDLARIRAAVAEAAPIAFRTADDFADYIEKAVAIGADREEAFDEAVLQKVLPRIRGMDPVVGEALGRLVEITEGRYPLSRARAMRMLEDFRRGVASFF